MAIITEAELKRLTGFNARGALVVSLYLNVDGAKYPRLQGYEKELKSLLGRAEQEWLESGGLSKSMEKSLRADLAQVEAFVTGRWKRGRTKGLVVFACAARDFWQVYELPVAVPPALIVGVEPYAKTLTAVLGEYKRFCVVCVSRKKSRLFTVYLGEIEEHQGVFVDEWVPDQVKEGDWANLRQSRIARHIEDHVLHHLKDVAGLTYRFFLGHDFDRLIVAGHKELLPRFTAVLHPYLRERLAGELLIDPDAPLAEILRRSLIVEEEVQGREEAKLLNRLHEESRPGGLGVTGLSPTVEALMRGQAYTLLIGDGYAESGYICYRDHYLAVHSGDCPICGASLDKSSDIVEDMVQVAVNHSVQIEHISHVPEFSGSEKIGALLRFGL